MIFRYSKRHKTTERYICFIDVTEDCTSEGLLSKVIEVIGNFGIGDKLIGRTYDGALVISSVKNGLQAKIKERYGNVDFFYFRAHKVNIMIKNTMKSNKFIRDFIEKI